MTLEGPETRVFEMKYGYMWRIFEEKGLSSARFDRWQDLDLQPGTTVAQVDLNGSVTRVDWVVVEEIITTSGVPRLVLSDGVAKGGSGGGVFLNGIHIANNWQSVEHINGAGEIVAVTSVAPLNS